MRRVLLITGPPCAGKTSLALDLAAADGGRVIDRDLIARDLGSRARWSHSRRITQLAETRMRAALDQLADADDVTAYVVRCLPYRDQRDALAARLGADVRVLDPGLAECLRRARVDRRPEGTEDTIRMWYARAGLPTEPGETVAQRSDQFRRSQEW